MKRSLKIYILFIYLIKALTNFAYDFEKNGIYYNIISSTNNTVEVTYGNKTYWNGSYYYACKYSGDVIIPSEVQFNNILYKVIGIDKYAFCTEVGNEWADRFHNALTSIKIPDGIEYIGERAFLGCDGLSEVIIPKSVNRIDIFAFSSCDNIKVVYLCSYLPPEGPYGIFGYNGISGNYEIVVPQLSYYSNNVNWLPYGDRLKEMVTFYGNLTYNGNIQKLPWENNISALKIDVEGNNTDVDAGEGQTEIQIQAYRNGLLFFETSFPFYYIINKAVLEVIINNAERIYGDPNPPFRYMFNGFVNDDNEKDISETPIIYCEATPNSDIGEYDILGKDGFSKNYFFVYKNGILSITKAPLIAKINSTKREYGAQNPSFSLKYEGLKNNETSPSWIRQPKFQTEANKFSNVGDYIVEAIDYEATNYNIEQIENGIISVLPSNLIISGNNQSRLYYEPSPSFSYKVTGFKNNDDSSIITVTPVLTSTADISSDCGKYEINVSDAKLSNNNYNIIYQNSTLTINPRNLNVFVEDCERPYGQDNPEFHLNYEGFVNNQNEEMLSMLPIASTKATVSSNVGTYSINITGGKAVNYKFTYIPGKLTIVKADQRVIWNQDLTTLSVGQQIELTAYSSSGLPITYDIENNNICEIYSVGEKKYLDCIKEGEVQIRASQVGNNNYNATTRTSKQVIIKGQFVPAESITVNPTKLILNEGESVQLSAKIEPVNATQTFFWSSSNNNVVTVSENGFVTAISAGNVIITVSNGDIFATCEVEVIGNAGVNDIVNDPVEIQVYNLQGLKLNIHSRNELNRLKRGIYIINGKKEYVF